MIISYRITETIESYADCILYRAAAADVPFNNLLVRVFPALNLSQYSRSMIEKEFDAVRLLREQRCPSPVDTLFEPAGATIVYSDCGGRSLQQKYFSAVSTEEAIRDVVCILEALKPLHAAGLVHGALNPGTVYFAEDGACLYDCGLSHLYRPAGIDLYGAFALERVLPCISPEQTGRVRGQIDHRTDIYSVGVLLYKMLTGAPPFVYDDPAEIIHAHLAREPLAPGGNLPAPLSEVILKCLSKNPDMRYQSCGGLAYDLNICLEAAETGAGPAAEFVAGARDFPPRLAAPRRVYGRDAELAVIDDAAADSLDSISVIAVTGPAGIGKSALINEACARAADRGFRVIYGRCGQYAGSTPYSPFVQAFEELASLLLFESGEWLDSLKSGLSAVPGTNPGLLVEMAPGLEPVFGRNAPPSPGNAVERNIIFNHTVRSFLSVFSELGMPLFLVLDDLQWSDPESVRLIRELASGGGIKDIVIILSFRNTETGPSHPLTVALVSLETGGVPLKRISLPPLGTSHISELLGDMMKVPYEECSSLAGLIAGKTRGNPFFIIRFLMKLRDQGLLSVDHDIGWKWDIQAISRSAGADNVAELLSSQIGSLPDDVRVILSAASCLGEEFDPELLASVTGLTSAKAMEALIRAESDGFIVFTDNGVSFSHDRIQETLHSMLDAADSRRIHFSAAEFLINNSPGAGERNLFQITDHLNMAGSLIESEEKKITAARFCLRASERSLSSSAYSASLEYSSRGISHLPRSAWETDYGTAFTLHRLLLQSEYHAGHFSEAERIFADMISRPLAKTDRAGLFCLMIGLQTHQEKLTEAIKSALGALKEFGIELREHPPESELKRELRLLRPVLLLTRIDSLLFMPEITDPEQASVLKLLTALITPSYYADPVLMSIAVVKALKICLSRGNRVEASIVYVCAGFLISSKFGDYVRGFAFGELGVKLSGRYGDPEYLNRTYYLFTAMIHQLKRPVSESPALFREAVSYAVQAGDMQYAGRGVNNLAAYRFIAGDPIKSIINEYASYGEFINRTGEPYIMGYYRDNMAMMRCLAGYESIPDVIENYFTSSDRARDIFTRGNRTELFHFLFNRLRLLYISGGFQRCIDDAKLISQCLPAGALHEPEGLFFIALSFSAAPGGDEAAGTARKKIREIAGKLQKRARSNPSLWRHRIILLRAEIMRLKGRHDVAGLMYEEAIEGFVKNGFSFCAAIACELAAVNCASAGKISGRTAMLLAARHHYTMWGALSKAEMLDKAHPGIFTAAAGTVTNEPGLHDSEKTDYPALIDVRALIAGINTLSGEIVLERLLDRIMAILIRNSGATLAAIELYGPDSTLLYAEGSADRDGAVLVKNPGPDTVSAIPQAVLNYVRRTSDTVIIDDTGNDRRFKKNLPASGCLFCMPLISNSLKKGVIYLENSLTPGAFDAGQTGMIKMLSTQIAITLENAVLFDRMKQAENELAAQYEEIQAQYEEMESLNEELARSQNEIIAASEKIRREKELLLTTLNSIADGVILCGRDSVVEIANPAAVEILETPAGWADGRPLAEVLNVTGGDGACMYNYWIAPLLVSGHGVNTGKDARLITPGGVKKPVAIKGAPIWDSSGAIFGAVMVIRDLTLENEMEENILRASKIESLAVFAGGIAHDFNNILTGITGNISLLKMLMNNRNADPEQLSLTESAEKGTLRARELTMQLSTFARGGNPVKKRVSVMDLIQETANFALSGSNVTCDYSSAHDLISADIDPGRISQVIHNLIINARQAMPGGGVISVRADNLLPEELPPRLSGESPYLKIVIKDQGTGISAENIESIFDPYFTTKKEGKGLGLAVSYSIIIKHGGDISVSSKSGEGTSFTILLPGVFQNSEGDPDSSKVLKRKLSGTVLIMDDDSSVVRTAENMLTHLGMSVWSASHGEEALALYKNRMITGKKFDLVIMDLTIPGKMGGAEAVQKMKAMDPAARVIVSSGYSDDPVMEDYENSGFDDMIRKPYTIEEMEDMLQGNLP